MISLSRKKAKMLINVIRTGSCYFIMGFWCYWFWALYPPRFTVCIERGRVKVKIPERKSYRKRLIDCGALWACQTTVCCWITRLIIMFIATVLSVVEAKVGFSCFSYHYGFSIDSVCWGKGRDHYHKIDIDLLKIKITGKKERRLDRAPFIFQVVINK